MSIDTTKVTHTRAGYKVTNVRYYPNNGAFPIIANVEFEGKVEPETFTKEGMYHGQGLAKLSSGYDLIENQEEPIRHQVEEIDVISDFLESLAFSLSVCITELDRIKEEKRE